MLRRIEVAEEAGILHPMCITWTPKSRQNNSQNFPKIIHNAIILPDRVLVSLRHRISGCKGFERGLVPRPWKDLESRTPIMVPYSTLKQFLGDLQGNLLSRSAQGSGVMPLRKVIVGRQQIC